MAAPAASLLICALALALATPAEAAQKKHHQKKHHQEKDADEAAPGEKVVDEGETTKPIAPRPYKYWCQKGECTKFCGVSGIDKAAVAAAAARTKTNLTKDMVDAAVAIQPELEKLGCKPAGGKEAGKASRNCGIEFNKGKGHRFILPGLARGLAKAALGAQKEGVVISVGSTVRSLEQQVELMCKNHRKGMDPPCSGNTGLACPGPNVHTDGFAVDLHLESTAGKSLTQGTGNRQDCKARKKQVLANPHLKKLNDIMFAAGWWKYCEEVWHFEYTQNPYNHFRKREY